MATSEVSICNQALSWLGENTIIALTDASKAAQLCAVNYEPLRDAVLESRDWAFAMARAVPAAVATGASWGYSYRFPLPTDCIRPIFFGQNSQANESSAVDDWQREGTGILANVNVGYLRYIRRVTDPSLFPPLFTQAFAARIAADLAMPLTNSRTLQADMFKLYGAKLSDAGVSDAMQGRTRVILSQDLSINARIGGGR